MLLLIFLPKVRAIRATMLMSLESFDRRITGSIVPERQSATRTTYLHMETQYKTRIRELEQRLDEASAANFLSAQPENALGGTVSTRISELENLSSRVLELEQVIGKATAELDDLSANLAKGIQATESAPLSRVRALKQLLKRATVDKTLSEKSVGYETDSSKSDETLVGHTYIAFIRFLYDE
mmetsp:Transcript_43162/g.90662  ORF Transcript_43162/g.90662 Transcript_43162/m.90662 type:complete len:183 (+) Transcript_43162:2-550(+)